jgi:hypothetical protein
MNNITDPKNIAGLSNLLSNDDIESTMDLSELEREIAIGAEIDAGEEINIADEYKKEMNRISLNFNITQPDTEPEPEPIEFNISPPQSTRTIESNNDSFISRNAYNSPTNADSDDKHGFNSSSWDSFTPRDNQLRNMTQEEQKQNKIHQVLHDIDENEMEFNIEKEKEEDDKASLLEQIDMLKITLEDDGIDVSGVPTINKQSTMKEVQDIYKILRLKNDRNRYCSFAEELILAGSHGIEYMFDGKKDWLGRKPDLTGWSDTVKVKLRRMRYETSTFVQEVMQEYNMSAGTRLALELLPSMFLYSRSRRLTRNDNLVSDSDYKDAISNMNSM